MHKNVSFCSYKFQSTLPRRERLFNSVCIIQLNIFQSTLPRRERLEAAAAIIAAVCDFNPRSREGSDFIPIDTFIVIGISIHAPAKGATGNFACDFSGIKFQSTLPRRERPGVGYKTNWDI